jgi:hypothetical protein
LPKGPKQADRNLRDAKDKVFAKLAHLDWVSGVGIAKSKLAIYLTRPPGQEETRQISDIVAAEAPGQKVELVTTGAIKKQR